MLNLDNSIPKTLLMKESEFSNVVLHSKKTPKYPKPKKQSPPNNWWKKPLNLPRYLFGEFSCPFEEFIRPTTATIKYESDPMLADVYQALFFMNTDLPNVIYHDTHRHLAARPHLPVPPVRCQLLKNRCFLRHLYFAHKLQYLIPFLPLHTYSSL